MRNAVCLVMVYQLGLALLLGVVVGVMPKALPELKDTPVSLSEGAVSEIIINQKSDLYAWIEKLGDNEGCSTIGTPDNGSLSYGRWCYKSGTFKMFVKKYNLLPDTEENEIMNWIGDNSFQRILTRAVFNDSITNASHWKNTVKKIGNPPIN